MKTVPANRSWEVLHFPEPPAAHTNETRGPTDGVKERDKSERAGEPSTHSVKLLLTRADLVQRKLRRARLLEAQAVVRVDAVVCALVRRAAKHCSLPVGVSPCAGT